MDRYDRVKGIVVLEGWTREDTLNDLSGYGDWVIFLEVQFAGGGGDHVGGYVEPVVSSIGFAVNVDRRGLTGGGASGGDSCSGRGSFMLSDRYST